MKNSTLWRSLFSVASAVLIFNAGNLFATTVALVGGQGTAGASDGNTYTEALFNTPSGMAMDAYGQLWVADAGNNVIRIISAPETSQSGGSGTVTFAPVDSADLIVQPIGVALDDFGNVYILNYGNGKNGNILEYNVEYGYIVATNAMNLTNAAAMGMDTSGNIYVTMNNNQILKYTAPGVSNLIVTITNAGTSLKGLVVKQIGAYAGWLAVCDAGRNGIYLVNPANGTVITNAGFHGAGDFPNGTDVSAPQFAQFKQPMGVAETGDGSLIVTDYGNNRVKVVKASDGGVTNLYGVVTSDWDPSPYPGFSSYLEPSTGAPQAVVIPDAPGGVAAREPNGVIFASDGTVFVTEEYYNLIREATASGLPLPPPPAPTTPTGLIVVTNSAGVLLTWTASPGATNYTIYRATSLDPTFVSIGNTSSTTFEDTDPDVGETNSYEVSASNTGGSSGNSVPASIFIFPPPPPEPEIGWYDFEGNTLTGFYSTLHPVSGAVPYTANNPINFAIWAVSNGVPTHYLTIPPAINGAAPSPFIGSTPPVYENNQLAGNNVNSLTGLSLSNGLVIIEAMNYEQYGSSYLTSSVDTAEFLFQVGGPTISGDNAAQFTVSDVTTNVTFFYTLDGSDPSNAPPSQQVSTTNGSITLSLNGSTNIDFQVRGYGYGPTADYEPSGTAPELFTPATFSNNIANQISWGFASGACSSAFIGAAGQTFYAPVTLTMSNGATLYSLIFNMTVSSTGPGITNPAPAAGPFNFNSMMLEPEVDTNTSLTVYGPIPPLEFASYFTTNLPPQDYVTNGSGQVFANLLTSNGNELAVGWVERFGFTNLYNTKAQTLISISEAHDISYPSAAEGEPNGVIVGAYSFQISPGATNGQQYQIQLNNASGVSDGVGATTFSVPLFTADFTNSAFLASGTLSAIKNVTAGSIPYLVGDVYPFRWFNAGDFGTGNMVANGDADVEQVFQSAIYGINAPPNGSDMYDDMDSAGGLGIMDTNPADEFYGYWTNAGTLTIAQEVTLMGGNFTNINQMAFGDGKLDVSDVYVTFLRSQFTNQLFWFQRLWTNGVRVAIAGYAPGVIASSGAVQKSSGGGKIVDAASGGSSLPVSITNTPVVDFTATDYVASAGQTLSIPINATVFGPYPMNMTMLNLSVVPLDGSPALTTPVSFTLNPPFNNASKYNSELQESGGNNNYSLALLPTGLPIPAGQGISGFGVIGTLSVTLPTNATAMSSYAIHFDHASASPNGVVSFPRHTLTGLITLSSRSSSYYNDGIPDSWRLRYFGTIYNLLSVSNADADGTAMENWQKYQAGLDPTDPTSVLNVGTDQAVAQNSQDSVIYWPTVNGETYVIERSASLFPANWIPVSTNIGNGTYIEIHDSPTNLFKFYQVVVP